MAIVPIQSVEVLSADRAHSVGFDWYPEVVGPVGLHTIVLEVDNTGGDFDGGLIVRAGYGGTGLGTRSAKIFSITCSPTAPE